MSEPSSSFPAPLFIPNGKRLSVLAYAFLTLLCLGFFLPGIATLPPTDRDESSFAQATKQMIETGNYFDIRLQDKPRYQKPVGIYWLQALSVKLLNPHHLNEIWAYRVPSVIGATLAVLMTAALGTLLFGPGAGLLAAIMFSGCIALNAEAHLAKTDAALLGCVMLAQYALARAYVRTSKCRWGVPFLFWTALGAGILIKGPIILLVVLSTLLWLRLTDKNLDWFPVLKPLFGLPYTLFLIAPWFIAIAIASQGEFYRQSAGHDMLAKIWEGQNHGIMPPGLHLLIFPIVFFPFALLSILAVPDAWAARRKAVVRFCLGWIIPTWIVFEMSMTKLPQYALPTYPAIAMLTAKALTDGYPVLMKREKNWFIPLAIGLWLMVGAAYAIGFVLLPYYVDHVWNSEQIAAGAFLLLMQSVSLLLLIRAQRVRSVVAMTIGTLLFMAITIGATLPSIEHLWISREIVETAERVKPCEKLQLISSSYSEPSLIFLAGTGTKIFHDGGQAARDLRRDSCSLAVIDGEHKEAFLAYFSTASEQPMPMGVVEGFNSGHGQSTELTFYMLPSIMHAKAR